MASLAPGIFLNLINYFSVLLNMFIIIHVSFISGKHNSCFYTAIPVGSFHSIKNQLFNSKSFTLYCAIFYGFFLTKGVLYDKVPKKHRKGG